MNYKHDYLRNMNPLQNYYSNVPIDPKGAQIKKYSLLHSESRVQRIFLMPNLNLKFKKVSPNLNRRNLSSNLAIPVKVFKKFYQPPV